MLDCKNRCTNTHQNPEDATLAHVYRDDLIDQLCALRDVLEAYDLLQTFVDPEMGLGTFPLEVNRKQLGAWLRILNEAMNTRLVAIDGLANAASR